MPLPHIARSLGVAERPRPPAMRSRLLGQTPRCGSDGDADRTWHAPRVRTRTVAERGGAHRRRKDQRELVGSSSGHAIFAAINALAESPDVVRTRLVNGKVTLIHRRVWPAVVRVADRFPIERLAAIREEHTATGAHRARSRTSPTGFRATCCVMPNACRRTPRSPSFPTAFDRHEKPDDGTDTGVGFAATQVPRQPVEHRPSRNSNRLCGAAALFGRVADSHAGLHGDAADQRPASQRSQRWCVLVAPTRGIEERSVRTLS